MKQYHNQVDLTKRIDLLRKQMIEIGIKNGLLSPETLFHSQELDKLIYSYQLKSQNHLYKKSDR